MSYSSTVLADSPLAYWQMQEASGTSAADSGSAGDTGTYSGVTLGQSTLPLLGKGASFDGSTSGVSASSLSIAGSISVEFWFATSFNSQTAYIIEKEPASTNWAIVFYGGNLIWRGGDANKDLTAAMPTSGVWHHCVCTQTGTTAIIYIDGVQAATRSDATAINNASGTVYIGRKATGTYYNGLLTQVAVYSTVLSSARVLAHTKAGMGAVTTAAGNWSSNATWYFGAPPASTEDAILNHATTWDTGFTVASLRINSSPTISATGLTFNLGANGAVYQANHVGVAVGAGNTIAGVQGSPFVWQVGAAGSPGNDTWLALNGTSGSHVPVRDGRFTYDSAGTTAGTGVVRSTFADFLRCGDTINPAIMSYQGGASNVVQHYDGTFNNCGSVQNYGSLLGSDTLDIQRCSWSNTCPAGETLASAQGSVTTAGSTSRITIPSPPTVPGAIGWNVYGGTTNGSGWVLQSSGVNTLGTALTLTAPLATGTGSPPSSNPSVLTAPAAPVPTTVATGGTIPAGTYYFVITYTYNAVAPLKVTCSTTLTTGTRNVARCYFDQPPTFSSALGFAFADNVFAQSFTLSTGAWASFARNLIRKTGQSIPNILPLMGDSTDCYLLADGTGAPIYNPHHVNMDPAFTSATFDGWIYQNAAVSNGKFFVTNAVAGASTYRFRRIIGLPASGAGVAGFSSGALINAAGTANLTMSVEHCTRYAGDGTGSFETLSVGETGAGAAGEFSSYRGNITWSNTAGTESLHMLDIGHAGSGTGIATDLVSPANADYNAGVNLAATYTVAGNGWFTNQGRGYAAAFSATPGAHDLVNADPQFVDPTRNFEGWDASLAGGAGTIAHALSRFQAKDPAYTVSALIAWVRAGFVPQSASYKNASYPGDPLSADIGAVPAVVPSVTSYKLTGPSPASGTVGVASGNFTVALGLGTLAGSVTITPNDGGGGTFAPASLTLTNTTRSRTFAYTPGSSGAKTIAATNNGGLADPTGISFMTAVAGPPGYTLAGPSTIDVGVAGTFTVRTNVAPGAAVIFTPNDGGKGGTFAPATVSVAAGATSATFTYTPASPGTIAVAATNNGGLPDAVGRSYVVTQYGTYKPAWEANMSGKRASWLANASPAPAPLALDADNHYDPLGTWEAIRRYTGDAATYDPCVAVALYQKRDASDLANAGAQTGYHNFTNGPRDHYCRTGDHKSREAVILLSRNGAESNPASSPTNVAIYSYSRECAFAIMSYLDAEEMGCAHLARTETFVNFALGHINYWMMPGASWAAGQFMQPFMVGLTCKSLIAYWDRYRDSNNAALTNLNNGAGSTPQLAGLTTIPMVVKAMLDTLWTGSHGGYPFWYPDQHNPAPGPDGNTTTYAFGPANTGCFGYFYPFTTGEGGPWPSCTENLLIAPAFYWYYQFSGDDTYRQRADAIFAGSESSVLGIYTAGGTQKEFNQNYWWSTVIPTWRNRAIAPPPAATSYTLTAPSPASGAANVPSDRFVVALPASTSVANPVTVTFGDGGAGGRFLPATVRLTTDKNSLVTRYVPASAGPVTVSTTNDGGLANPAPATYTAGAAATLATGYTLTPPALPSGPHFWTDPWTLALAPSGSVPGRSADALGGLVDFTTYDGYIGAFGPGFAWLAAEAASGSFLYNAYYPRSRPVSTSNTAGYADSTITYTPFPTDYTLTAPSPASGPPGSASGNFTVALAHGTPLAGVVIPVTVGDGGAGGTFSASTFNISAGSPTATFTYTPASAGAKTITPTNTSGYVDAAPVPYTANPPTATTTTYTLTAPTPASGVVGSPSGNFAVALSAGTVLVAPATIRPTDGAGGVFNPTTLILSNTTRSGTFTYAPATAGARSIAVASGGVLTDPAPVPYTANPPTATSPATPSRPRALPTRPAGRSRPWGR